MKNDKKKIKGFIDKKAIISYPLIFISTLCGLVSHFFLSPYSQKIEKDLCCSLYENKTDDVILISGETEEKMSDDFYEKYCFTDNRGLFEPAKYSKNISANNSSFPLISTSCKESMYFAYNHMSSLTTRGFEGFKDFNDENAVYLTEQLAKNIFSISTPHIDSSILNRELIVYSGNNAISLFVKGIIKTDEESALSSSGFLFQKQFGDFGVVSSETIEKFEQGGILQSFYTKSFLSVSTFAGVYDNFHDLLSSKKIHANFANDFVNNTIKDLKALRNSPNYIVPGVLLTIISLSSFGFATYFILKSKTIRWLNAIMVIILTFLPYVVSLEFKIKINENYSSSIYTNGSVLFASLISVIIVFLVTSKYIFIKNKLDENKFIEIEI